MAHDRVGEEGHPPLPVWKGAGRTQSCCAIVEYNPAGWGALASRPNTGPDYPFNINNELMCAATAHSSTIHTLSPLPFARTRIPVALSSAHRSARACTRAAPLIRLPFCHTGAVPGRRSRVGGAGPVVVEQRSTALGSSSPCRICSRTSSASQLSA